MEGAALLARGSAWGWLVVGVPHGTQPLSCAHSLAPPAPGSMESTVESDRRSTSITPALLPAGSPIHGGTQITLSGEGFAQATEALRDSRVRCLFDASEAANEPDAPTVLPQSFRDSNLRYSLHLLKYQFRFLCKFLVLHGLKCLPRLKQWVF